MQFSLPVSVPASPEPAACGAGSANPAAGATGPADADPTGVPFETLLGGNDPAPATPKVSPDVETASSILASALWMPVAPPPTQLPVVDANASAVAGPASPGGDTAAPIAPEVPTAAVNSFLFASRPARAFSSMTPDAGGARRLGARTNTAVPAAPAMPPVPLPPTAKGITPVGPDGLAKPAQPTPVTAPETTTTPVAVATEFTTVAQNGTVATSETAAKAVAPATPADVTEIETADEIVAPLAGTTTTGRKPAGAGERAQLSAKSAIKENIAVAPRFSVENAPAKNLPEKKDFLNTDRAGVNARSTGVGIGVAEQAVSMSPNPSNRSKSAPAAELAPVLSVTVEKLSGLAASADSPTPPATVRQALAAVVSAIDALARKEMSAQKSVDMQFRVGDEQLALRVELRDGTVHTTFRAQSAELRSELANQWQSVVQPAGREIRIADPVFNSSSPGGDSAFGSLNHGTPHQRGHGTPESAAFGRDFADATAEPAVAAPSAAPVPGSASLLNALA